MSTDTHGLSRKEHLIVKFENGEPLNDEEVGWAAELIHSGDFVMSVAPSKEKEA